MDTAAATDLTETCWRDDLWMQAYGLLSPATVLEYFALSPFYDRACNNEAARQRGLRLEQLPVGAPGVEFVLQDSQAPHLFVIRKQLRSLAGAVTSQVYYYVLDGTIYQAPSLCAALAARMERCTSMVRRALAELRTDLDPLTAAPSGVGRQLEAELGREQQEVRRVTQASRDQQRRAERSVVAALLQHPLPVPSALLSTGADAAGPAMTSSQATDAVLPAHPVGGVSGVGVSQYVEQRK